MRSLQLEKDLERNSIYIRTVHDGLQRSYMIPVGEFNPKYRPQRAGYLPHHAAVKPNKPGKVRRVLNVVSKFHAKSLKSYC